MPKFELAGACDCHVHVFGDPGGTGMDPDRAYTPPEASVDALEANMARLGVDRCVLVQPSVYGTDNSVMLAALRRLGDRARAVCVLDRTVSDAELASLHEAGVRGLRLNLESGGETNVDSLALEARRWAPRIAPLGWHLQLYADFETVMRSESMLVDLGLPVVLDHFAMLPTGSREVARQGVGTLGRMLATGRILMKCSGHYRLPTLDLDVLSNSVAELHEMAPGSLLWASDWPHTGRTPGAAATDISPFRQMGSSELLHVAYRCLPTAGMRHDVLVANPARLYGFPS